MSPKKQEESIGKKRMDAVLLAYNVRTYIQTLVSRDQADLMLDAISEGMLSRGDGGSGGIDDHTLIQQLGPERAVIFRNMNNRDHDTIRAIAMIALGEKP